MTRVGGDEFVILVDDYGAPDDLAALARRVIDAIARPFDVANNEYYLGVSIGISLAPRAGSSRRKPREAACGAPRRQAGGVPPCAPPCPAGAATSIATRFLPSRFARYSARSAASSSEVVGASIVGTMLAPPMLIVT